MDGHIALSEAKRAGMDDMLRKPILFSEVAKCIENAIPDRDDNIDELGGPWVLVEPV